MSSSVAFQEAVSHLGKSINPAEVQVDVQVCCEPFICSLYTNNKKAGSSVNDIRYWLFCQKGQKNENLPPTQDSLTLHVKRAHYQTMVWRRALQRKQDLPSPAGNGWEIRSGVLHPVLMTKDAAPTGLIELTVCNCKTSFCRRTVYRCQAEGLACTESCSCMASEDCKNPNNKIEETLDEDDSEDETEA